MRIDRVVTSGLFRLEDVEFEVDNNVWIIGDDDRVVVIDAAHAVEPILEVIADRKVEMIISTHGHFDHINKARELAAQTDAPIGLHPADRMLWDLTYEDSAPDLELREGQLIEIGSGQLSVLHTPGHTPGSVCLQAEGEVFGGDTLFNGGPGATQFKYGDYDLIVESIKSRLLVLPDATVIRPGHGDDTTVGQEKAGVQGWSRPT